MSVGDSGSLGGPANLCSSSSPNFKTICPSSSSPFSRSTVIFLPVCSPSLPCTSSPVVPSVRSCSFHLIILLLAVVEVGAGVGVVGVIVAMGGIGANCLCLLHRPPLVGGGGGGRGGRRRAKGADSGTRGGRRTVPVDLPN